MTEEVARGLLVEPERHLPAILANLQANTMEAVIQHIYSSLPGIVTSLTQQSSATRQSEEEFFGQWPALNNPESKTVVSHAIQTYRALNPAATKQEIIRAAGLSAMITLRKPLPAELFAPQPPAPAPAAPGFAHAAPAASAPRPVAGGETNPFALLNEEFDRDERQ